MVSVDDYQEALKVRLSSSRGRVFLIEGNEISSAVPVAGLDAGKKLSLFRRRHPHVSAGLLRSGPNERRGGADVSDHKDRHWK